MTLLRLVLILAILTLAAACSPSESRSCEIDDNCFNDERCVAGFCQRAETDPDTDDPDATQPDADAAQPDASDDEQPDADASDTEQPDADVSCDPGLTLCADQCVDVLDNEDFCGDCQTSCQDNETCLAGTCAPAAELIVVDSDADTGFFNGLALDADNAPHLVYFAPDANAFRYAFYDGTSWQLDRIAESITMSSPALLYIDAERSPHIAFIRDNPPRGMNYVARSSGNWNSERPTAAASPPLSLAPGAGFRPYISTVQIPFNELSLLYLQSDGQWNWEDGPNSGSNIRLIALAGDASTALSAAYKSSSNDLYFARRTSRSDAWTEERIALNSGFADTLKLALTDSATPVVATLNLTRTELLTYRRSNTSWSRVTTDVGTSVTDTASTNISLAATDAVIRVGLHIDSSDRARVLQLDLSTGDWTTLLDQPAHPDSNTSIAIDSEGRTHVSFVTPEGHLAYIRLP